jgi:hypothetical protein
MGEYIAVIRKDPDHGYAVTFPDFPGLTAFAAFFESQTWQPVSSPFILTK